MSMMTGEPQPWQISWNDTAWTASELFQARHPRPLSPHLHAHRDHACNSTCRVPQAHARSTAIRAARRSIGLHSLSLLDMSHVYAWELAGRSPSIWDALSSLSRTSLASCT